MVFQTKRGSSSLRRRLGARSLVALSLCVALASVGGASIATGAPVAQIAGSPLKIAKKALRIARGANKRSKQALNVANQALSQSGQPGPKGDKGDKGDPGDPGADGTSVTSAVEPAGANCADGGSAFTAANGVTYACNGADGADGAPGDPWTAGGTLPAGETETGAWSMSFEDSGGQANPVSAISFPIPLKQPLAADDVHHEGQANFATTCPGSAANPTAVDADSDGELCAYTGSFFNGDWAVGFAHPIARLSGGVLPPDGADTAGARLMFFASDSPAFGFGSFAVVGPPAP